MKRLAFIAFNLYNMKVLAATIVTCSGLCKVYDGQHQNYQSKFTALSTIANSRDEAIDKLIKKCADRSYSDGAGYIVKMTKDTIHRKALPYTKMTFHQMRRENLIKNCDSTEI